MYKILNKYILLFFIFLTICICFKIVKATNDEITSLIQNLNNEIGENNTTNMFQEIQEKIKNLKNKTNEEISNIIKNYSEKYGVIFNEEQINTLTNYFKTIIKEDDTGIFNAIKNLFHKFINWIKGLKDNSNVDIEPINTEDNSFIESKNDKVTINIPTVNQFDNIMNKIIDTIKNYIFVENKEDT